MKPYTMGFTQKSAQDLCFFFLQIQVHKSKTNIGKRWTNEEEEQLTDEFKQNLKIGEIAKIHQRKYGGIKARLRRMGLID